MEIVTALLVNDADPHARQEGASRHSWAPTGTARRGAWSAFSRTTARNRQAPTEQPRPPASAGEQPLHPFRGQAEEARGLDPGELALHGQHKGCFPVGDDRLAGRAVRGLLRRLRGPGLTAGRLSRPGAARSTAWRTSSGSRTSSASRQASARLP